MAAIRSTRIPLVVLKRTFRGTGWGTAQTLERRLLDKVRKDPQSGCWVFTGHRVRKEYGQIGVPSGLQLTHRVSYELFCGPIPDGLDACHRCDNPPCVNPAHLFLGTPVDNSQDAVAKGRHAAGERHGRAKLTAAQVEDIRAAAARGEPQRNIAERFGVARWTIRGILDRSRWQSVGGETRRVTKPGRRRKPIRVLEEPTKCLETGPSAAYTDIELPSSAISSSPVAPTS